MADAHLVGLLQNAVLEGVALPERPVAVHVVIHPLIDRSRLLAHRRHERPRTAAVAAALGVSVQTNNVVPAMHNHRGEVANSIDMFKQVVVSFKEAIVREVVTFYARQRDRLLRFAEFVNQFLIWQKS